MSTFFKSEQVQENLQDIFRTYQEIAAMSQRLPEMSREQRVEHIEDCIFLVEKQRTFYTRLSLSAPTDDEAADMKMRINAMSQAFGFSSLYECLDKLKETLAAARKKELDT